MHLGHDHSCGASDHSHLPSIQSAGGPSGETQASAKLRTTLVLGIVINLVFVAIEFVAGWWANSVALLADAVHNLGDVVGLVLSLIAVKLAQKKPTERMTWGYRRSSMLAALAHAVMLLALVAFTVSEGIGRLLSPAPVHTTTMIVVALVGIGINGLTAWLLFRHDQNDLNVRGAFIHMLGDAAVSVGVVAAGVAVALTSFTWLDPVVSFLIAGVILAGSWRLLTQSLALNLDAVPRRLTLREISDALRNLPGVTEVHDLHVWSTSTTSVALTAHLVLPEPHSSDKLLKQATELLSSKFKITHSTIQIERAKLFEEHCGCP